MSANIVTNDGSTAAYVVDDAVGVAKSYWFVAIVSHNAEKKAAEKLGKLNIEHYLPTQTEIRVWKNGRKAKVERIVIPATIFVYCTEQQRREIVGYPFINRFMTNKAGSINGSTNKPLAVIPEAQIENLRFMLGQSENPVRFLESRYNVGDLVKIIRGQLRGLIGNIYRTCDNQTHLVVSLGVLGGAYVNISLSDIERI